MESAVLGSWLSAMRWQERPVINFQWKQASLRMQILEEAWDRKFFLNLH